MNNTNIETKVIELLKRDRMDLEALMSNLELNGLYKNQLVAILTELRLANKIKLNREYGLYKVN